MNAVHSNFTGSVPEHYDSGLVPVIFEDYAKALTRSVARCKPDSVLELAAGTGVVTRMLRDGLPGKCDLLASDLNEPMLEVARGKFKPGENVAFETIDAMEIPLESASFDVVTCQFGVMFFPDKAASYREALRVLKPGGTYLFSLWDSHNANPFARLGQQLCEEMYPDNPPGFCRVPFHYHDVAEIEEEVRQAGFGAVSIERRAIEKSVPSFRKFAEGFVYGNPLAAEIEAMERDPAEMVGALIEVWHAEFGEAPTAMPLSALFVTAVK